MHKNILKKELKLEIKLNDEQFTVLRNIFTILDANHHITHEMLDVLRNLLKEVKTQTRMSEEYFAEINRVRTGKDDR